MTRLLLLSSIALLAACDAASDRIQGDWEFDAATLGDREERHVFTVQGDRLRFGLRGRSIILRRRVPVP
jgi:hypothetical protein